VPSLRSTKEALLRYQNLVLSLSAVCLLCFLQSRSHAQITEFKLSPSDGAGTDLFGRAIAVTDSFVIVGAQEDDDGGSNTGSAYLYTRAGSSWENEVKLNPMIAGVNDQFGTAVALTNDYAVIGEPFDGPERGEVYLFGRNGSAWTEVATLRASDGTFWDYFGSSVSIEGTTIVVGAYGNDQGRGAAYVFVLESGSWVEQAKLTASDAEVSDYFGIDVAISGDRILVGAQWNDEGAENAGAGYIFLRQGSDWIEEAKLMADDPGFGLLLGASVSLSGNTAILGARGDDHAGLSTGSAYVFTESAGSWSQEAKLTASDASLADFFGTDVSISESTALVGALGDDDLGSSSGSVYVFSRVEGVWVETDKWTASDGEASDHFGEAVVISGEVAAIGAPEAYGSSEAGAAYMYTGFSVVLACDEIDFFGAKCNATGKLQTMVKLFNSTTFAGQEVQFLVDDSLYSVELMTNGIHSIARLEVPGAGFGQHSVTLVDPEGCYQPAVFNCQVSQRSDLFDDLWEWTGELPSDSARMELVPGETRLIGNFPNPFNPSTTIHFTIGEPQRVALEVYNILGQLVRTVVSGFQEAGSYDAVWDGKDDAGMAVSSGIYIYKLTAGALVQSGQMLLVK